MDKALRWWLAFGTERVREVATLATALTAEEEFILAWAAASTRATDPRLRDGTIRARLELILASDPGRSPADQRRRAQSGLELPLLPTMTIGSYPQTRAIRVGRAALWKGKIDDAEYLKRMRSEVADVVALQEELGLDVLVHGEPERNATVCSTSPNSWASSSPPRTGCSPTGPGASVSLVIPSPRPELRVSLDSDEGAVFRWCGR